MLPPQFMKPNHGFVSVQLSYLSIIKVICD